MLSKDVECNQNDMQYELYSGRCRLTAKGTVEKRHGSENME